MVLHQTDRLGPGLLVVLLWHGSHLPNHGGVHQTRDGSASPGWDCWSASRPSTAPSASCGFAALTVDCRSFGQVGARDRVRPSCGRPSGAGWAVECGVVDHGGCPTVETLSTAPVAAVAVRRSMPARHGPGGRDRRRRRVEHVGHASVGRRPVLCLLVRSLAGETGPC